MQGWKRFLVALGAAGLLGCGADCAKLCEDAKKCAGANQSTDCEKTCEEAEKTAEGAGCESQYESMLDCTDDHKDNLCTTGESCKKELDALTTCMTK
jgi:hypothetical protein